MTCTTSSRGPYQACAITGTTRRARPSSLRLNPWVGFAPYPVVPANGTASPKPPSRGSAANVREGWEVGWLLSGADAEHRTFAPVIWAAQLTEKAPLTDWCSILDLCIEDVRACPSSVQSHQSALDAHYGAKPYRYSITIFDSEPTE